MGLLQALPSEDRLATLLDPVLGDDTTGVRGVVKLLESLDSRGLANTVTSQLGEALSLDVNAIRDAQTGDVTGPINAVLAGLPTDARALTAPLSDPLQTIRDQFETGVFGDLARSRDVLRDLDALPTDRSAFVGEATDQLLRIRDTLLNGKLNELRAWSGELETLRNEMTQVLSNGTGPAADRLMTYLTGQIQGLRSMVLPDESPANALIQALENAISAERMQRIQAAQDALIQRIDDVKNECDGGTAPQPGPISAARTQMGALESELEGLLADLQAAVSAPLALEDWLQAQYARIEQIEVVDVGNIRERFSEALDEVGDAVESIDLGAVREAVQGAFVPLHDAISTLDTGALMVQVEQVEAQLQTVLETVDGAMLSIVVTVRDTFGQLHEALRSVAGTLGTFDDDGRFHFHAEQQIADFLGEVQQTLESTVRPIIDTFRSAVGDTLQQVQGALQAVTGEIESVKNEIQGLLDGVNQQLQSLDVAGMMDDVANRLDAMLNELGAIDIDPVVNPVIAEIEEMRDALRGIDVSSLNDLTRGALQAATAVLRGVNFSGQITDLLVQEIDAILQVPRDGLNEIETRAEAVVTEFAAVMPDKLLEPLNDVFGPVQALMDELELDNLVRPLDEWYQALLSQLDQLEPDQLLQPAVEVYEQLTGALDGVSPDALIAELQGGLDSIKDAVGQLDIATLASDLTGAVQVVIQQVESISPEALLQPLIDAFTRIAQAMEQVNPAALLDPLDGIWQALGDTLGSLTDEQAQRAHALYGELRAAVDSLDPAQIFPAIRAAAKRARDLLAQLNFGGLLAALNRPYNALVACAGDAGAAAVEALNPLRNAVLGRAASELAGLQAALNDLAGLSENAALASAYDGGVRDRLERLFPEWAGSPADAIRQLFQVANPAGIREEIDGLFNRVRDTFRQVDPRLIVDEITALHTAILGALGNLDPTPLVARLQALLDSVMERVDALDFGLIARETQGLMDEIRAVAAGLDPRQMIESLGALVSDLKAMAADLRPGELLAELQGPLEAARELVGAFSPQIFIDALQTTFDEINRILSEIDVGTLLAPILDRLQQIRDELEDGLRRTETAFNAMLAAIPV